MVTSCRGSLSQEKAPISSRGSHLSLIHISLDAQSEEYKKKQEEYKVAQQEWAAWAGSNTDQSYVLGDGTGEFAWPIPGYTTLSSDFGTVRYIYGVKDVHRGMDVPAPAGTPIYAAADGVVSTNAHWSYGICVKISHSPSLVTIYGHMSARAAVSYTHLSPAARPFCPIWFPNTTNRRALRPSGCRASRHPCGQR